jgi:hypothetical protein
VFNVLDILFIAVLLDQQAGFTEIMPWHTREKMMCDLKVETSVNELDILGADYVHCRTELTGREGF